MTDRIRHPCRNVKLPRVQPLERSMPLPEDLARLVAAMDESNRPMVYLGAVLGLRFSEVAGLRVGRMDLGSGSVSVNETITRDPGAPGIRCTEVGCLSPNHCVASAIAGTVRGPPPPEGLDRGRSRRAVVRLARRRTPPLRKLAQSRLVARS